MRLGELKKSLARMSPDLDDCEVLVLYIGKDGQRDADCLAFTAYQEAPEYGVIILLGSEKEAIERIKTNTLHYPGEKKSPSEEGFDLT